MHLFQPGPCLYLIFLLMWLSPSAEYEWLVFIYFCLGHFHSYSYLFLQWTYLILHLCSLVCSLPHPPFSFSSSLSNAPDWTFCHFSSSLSFPLPFFFRSTFFIFYLVITQVIPYSLQLNHLVLHLFSLVCQWFNYLYHWYILFCICLAKFSSDSTFETLQCIWK